MNRINIRRTGWHDVFIALAKLITHNSTLITIFLALFALGCSPAAKFSLVEAGVPSLHGMSQLNGRATVTNGGGRDLMVESALVVVRYRDRELGAARLLLPVEIPAGATTRIRYDLALEGVSLSSMQTLRTRLLSNPAAFTVDVTGRVRWGAFAKKIELKGLPLTDLMKIMRNFAP